MNLRPIAPGPVSVQIGLTETRETEKDPLMKRTLLSLTLIALAAPALASDSVPTETQDQIRATLTEQGYDVRKIEMEDGMYEAYALKDGKRLEIYMDAQLNVVRVKEDD